MFNPKTVLAGAFGDYLARLYLDYFAGQRPDHAPLIGAVARLALERIAATDAPYHDAEHTMMVTLVGQQILRGKLMTEGVTPEDWLHFTVATLLHDIGYVRGACRGDTARTAIITAEGESVTPPRGATDAYLAPWHVTRGIIFVRERFADHAVLDAERLARCIAATRFPVSGDGKGMDVEGRAVGDEAALVRAADLIGQLGDPLYHRKVAALFSEFRENGQAETLGYGDAVDLLERYPEFFWSRIEPFIGVAEGHLEQTVEGTTWLGQLYATVFRAEHQRDTLGPFPG
ncbi:MAG: metal-dependent phosphohydrolase [Pseudomonadota bacterium]